MRVSESDPVSSWVRLFRYLAGKVEPNLVLLGHGLAQVLSDYCREARQWRRDVLKRLDSLDWQTVVRDERPFLEDPAELTAFTPETVRAMVNRLAASS